MNTASISPPTTSYKRLVDYSVRRAETPGLWSPSDDSVCSHTKSRETQLNLRLAESRRVKVDAAMAARRSSTGSCTGHLPTSSSGKALDSTAGFGPPKSATKAPRRSSLSNHSRRTSSATAHKSSDLPVGFQDSFSSSFASDFTSCKARKSHQFHPFHESWTSSLSCTGHSKDESTSKAATTMTTVMGSTKERRTKMNWLANNVPKRNLQEESSADIRDTTTTTAPPLLLKIIYPEGKAPAKNPTLTSGMTDTTAMMLADIPEEAAGGGVATTRTLTPHERRHYFVDSAHSNFSPSSKAKDSASARLSPEGSNESSSNHTNHNNNTVDISLSLRTLSGVKPVVAASTRRSSTSFVAGSQIRTIQVVR